MPCCSGRGWVCSVEICLYFAFWGFRVSVCLFSLTAVFGANLGAVGGFRFWRFSYEYNAVFCL